MWARVVICVAAAVLSVTAAIAAPAATLGGTVVDAATREALIGANVALLGTVQGTVTAADGSFHLTRVSAGALEFVSA